MLRRLLLVILTILMATPQILRSTQERASPPSPSMQLPESLRTFEVTPDIRIFLSEENALFLEVLRHDSDSDEDVARRVMRDPARWEVVKSF
ncbi:MAG: hypothetical protein L0170_19820, partial [Acidobacteria bacterium]|nr:hypothetical protein [Acidobacteriota bacterium]